MTSNLPSLTWQSGSFGADDFRDGLILALVHSGVCITLQDYDENYLFAANMPSQWATMLGDDPTDGQIFGNALGADIIALKKKALSTGELQRMEKSCGDDGEFEFVADPTTNDQEQVILVTTIIDVTEERHREKVLKGLLRELSHRTKNMLAIVLSIASQTAKQSPSLPTFLQHFRGRVHSLSASQDLVTDSRWNGARTNELFHDQLAKYFDNPSELLSVTGEDVVLSPNAAVHIGLAIHELIVALVQLDGKSDSEFTIDASSTVQSDGDGSKTVIIRWAQKFSSLSLDDGIEEADLEFSQSILTRIVPAAVNGEGTVRISDNAIIYELKFPYMT